MYSFPSIYKLQGIITKPHGIIQSLFSLLHVLYTLKTSLPFYSVGKVEAPVAFISPA